MTPLRLFTIAVIFFFTTIAWMILGGTVLERTGESNAQLREEVSALWGREHVQAAPRFVVKRAIVEQVERTVTEGDVSRVVMMTERREEDFAGTIEGSNIDVRFDLEHRKKGLLWWPTYAVDFSARYRVALPAPPSATTAGTSTDTLVMTLPMSAMGAVYDDFHWLVDGVEQSPVPDASSNSFVVTLPFSLGQRAPVVEVRYRSRGLGNWTYGLAAGGTTRVKDFALRIVTNVDHVDFPIGTLSPSRKERVGRGERLTWAFSSLVAGQNVGIELPAKLNPGPVAARIAFFAPVGLLFFITVMVIVGVVRERSLHPMNYFFVSAAFFAFHLLFAYLVDVLDVFVAFGISAATSVLLVVSYLRIVQGTKIAFMEAGIAQMLFLVGFSFAFFREGEAGLTVTIGAVLTLFFLMQLTARVKWPEKFASTVPQRPAPTTHSS